MDKTTDSSSSHQTSANAATAGNHGGGTPDFGGGGDTPPQTHHVVNSNDNISVGCGPSSTNTNNIGKQQTMAVASNGGGSAITSANSSIVSASSSTSSTPASSSAVVASHLQRSITNGAHHHHHHISLLGAHNVTTLQHTAPPHAVPQPLINLNISTTTGGNFGVTVDPQISVENLKKIISKKLKVAKDRICLLHREKELQDGTLKDNNLMDGSKIILIPNVETGLLAQRPENTVMQALESLNDSQVNDFLSGKTPLNLSMRLGDHMMLIQLQLSTVNPVNSSNSVSGGTNCSSSSLRTRSGQRSSSSRTAASSTTAAAGGGSAAGHHNHHHHHHHHHHHASAASNSAAGTSTARKIDSRIATGGGSTSSSSTSASVSTTTTAIKSSDLSSFLSKRDYESLQNIVKSIAMAQPARLAAAAAASSAMNPTVMPVAITPLLKQLPQQQQQTINTAAHTAAVAGPSPTILAAAVTETHQALRTTMPLVVSNTVTTNAFQATADATASSVTADVVAPSSEAAAVLMEQSPIKSLSNLVSSPIKTTAIKNIPIANGTTSSCSTAASSSSAAVKASTSIGSNASSAASPIQSTVATLSKVAAVASAATCQDPIAAKLTSCLCTRLNAAGGIAAVNKVAAKHCIKTLCLSRHERTGIIPIALSRTPTTQMPITSTPNYKACAIQSPTAAAPGSSCTALLHKTTNNPISRSKHRHHHHHHHHHHHYHHHAGGSSGGACGGGVSPNSCNGGASTALQRCPSSKQPVANAAATTGTVARCTTSASNDSGFASDDSALTSVSNGTPASTTTSVSTFTTSTPTTTTTTELDDPGIAASDTRTLAEASRNLTQTLRKLSKEVFTNKIDLSGGDDNTRKTGSGAVIESMKNHGKGIYSGTFSGTLNPALQDRYGRPKRDISTVIHILNDLLSATPQYSRGARISFEAPSTSSAAAAAASASSTTANGATTSHGSRSKQISSKHHQHSHSCGKCIKTSHTHTVSHHSSACAYGECNGHYVKTKSNYTCCQDLTNATTTGASSNASTSSSSSSSSSSSPTSNASTNSNDRNTCICRYRIIDETTGEREREHTCQKCLVDMENSKTKSKLDQLRLVMQQRKQKREARKLKGAPYGARVVGATATTTATVTTATAANNSNPTTMEIAPAASASSTTTPTTQPLNSGSSTLATPNDVSPNHIVEEVDTAA